MRLKSFPVRGLAAAAGIVAFLGLAASPAWAHVGVTASTTAAGQYTLLTFSVPHGCDGSATTKVKIQMPEEIYAVTPSVNPNWTVEKAKVALDKPITDAHGAQITERVDAVVYTAKAPLPSDLRDAFVLSLQIPKETEGKTLVFPVVQECEKGEAAWVQLPEAGQDPHSLDFPAPSFTVTAANDDHGSPAADPSASPSPDASETPVADSSGTKATGDSWKGIAVAGLVTGIAGIAVGAVALATRRRSA
jgi:uncharacterized protein YcnI